MNLINASEISSVRAVLKREVVGYEYREEKRFLGIRTRKAGFYYWITLSDYLVSRQELESKGYIVSYNAVYHKPSLEITMKNGNTHCKSFDFEKDLNNFLELYINMNLFIKL